MAVVNGPSAPPTTVIHTELNIRRPQQEPHHHDPGTNVFSNFSSLLPRRKKASSANKFSKADIGAPTSFVHVSGVKSSKEVILDINKE